MTELYPDTQALDLILYEHLVIVLALVLQANIDSSAVTSRFTEG